MNHWYWYVARPDELLIDCDSKTLLELFFKRLDKVNPALPYPLDVKNVFVAESSPGHFHVAVRTEKALPGVAHQIAWQLYLMDDVYRTCMNFFRALQQIKAPILLISPKNWNSSGVALKAGTFWRNPDAICQCPKAKHKSQKSILTCPAHKKLRG